MNRVEILNWLHEIDRTQLGILWRRADLARREHVGDAVYLRGLIEISNHCSRNCHYCGLRADRRQISRYRMTADEILACAKLAIEYGYGTVVLQSGDDPGIRRDWLADVVRRIKAETPLAITLSLGERDHADYAAWRNAGADRYLLRFETSNKELFNRIHPPLGREPSDRLSLLPQLRDLGYELGSGVMVGIPGQSFGDLANDIELFGELDLDMIGIGPFLPHPDTPLGHGGAVCDSLARDQVPNTVSMACRVIALARLVCPLANIPSTTALATLDKENGRPSGLSRGANIVMPNLTPTKYRTQYEIYPDKAGTHETAEEANDRIVQEILTMGRTLGQGRGDSPNRTRRQARLALVTARATR